MGIKNIKIDLSTPLGETGIGMDSQELIEFSCLLEKKFHIRMPVCNLTKHTNIASVINSIADLQRSSFLPLKKV